MLFRWLLPLAVLTAQATGCVDPRGRFEEFNDRQAEKRRRDEQQRLEAGMPDASVPDACAPATAEQLSGRYLFAAATPLGPDKPILALLDVTASAAGDALTAELVFEPVEVKDGQTPVGVQNEGTLQVTGTSLSAPSFHVILPGAANPVLVGTDAEADLELSGTVCADADSNQVELFCGSVTGNITVPLMVGLEGSTFGAVRVVEGEPFPALVTSCAATGGAP